VISGDHVLVENPVLQPNVYEVPKEDVLSLLFAREEDRISAVAPKLALLSGTGRSYRTGDVIVASPSDKTTHGFAAVVESVQKNSDGSQSLSLRQARFLDVLSDGDLFFSLHEKPSSYAGISASSSSYKAIRTASVSDIWNSLISGNFSAELPLDIPFPEISVPSEYFSSAKLDAKLNDVFKGSAKVEHELKLRSSFSFLLSIKNSIPDKIALHFPYTVRDKIDLELKGGVSVYEDDYRWTPPQDLDLVKGVLVAWAGPVPIPLPWALHVSGVMDIKVELNGGLDLGLDTTFNGDAGFYWDSKDPLKFPLLNPLPKLTKVEADTPNLSLNLSSELGIGPKLTLDLCLLPFSSATMTVGAKYETNFVDMSDLGKLEGKFKVKLTADLLELFKEGLAKIPGIGNLSALKFSLDVIDWTFWSKEFTAISAAPEIEWQKSLGGSGYDYAQSIQQTSDGGYIVAGSSLSTDGDVTGNLGNLDYWIVKLKP
jgi:hypothetical protein